MLHRAAKFAAPEMGAVTKHKFVDPYKRHKISLALDTQNKSIKDKHRAFKSYGIKKDHPITDCKKRQDRRRVLLAKGKVNHPGGAPGKEGRYKKHGSYC